VIELLGRAELGKVRPLPISGQPRREATSSTVEAMFRSPTSKPGRHPGSGQLLQRSQLADVVASWVGQMGGRDRARARPDLEGALRAPVQEH